ncbi:hypothetical protein [Kerstersia gyiorum]|uniref:Uncharacterized protein n=1 Tax=Kerstersia gyiorum TaxID=206506 RepID=A0A171KSG1_9BURK|nr:hypothetical protein [Kerstersia gyiorum]KKO71828.1 hypothetical protein AAV32_09655 [Kerstersia gyiorum]
MIDTKPAPVPLAERVRKSEAELRKRGGRRLPGGSLQPDAAQALDALMLAGYAPSATACIARALLEAAARLDAPIATSDRLDPL